MGAITVINKTVYKAVHLVVSELDAEQVVRSWLAQVDPEAAKAADLGPLYRAGAWGLRHPSGAVNFVTPEDFVREFDTIPEPGDEVAEFEKLLAASPSADDPNHLIGQQIVNFLGVLNAAIEGTLPEGEPDDETYDHGYVEGLVAAQRMFMTHFSITEVDPDTLP